MEPERLRPERQTGGGQPEVRRADARRPPSEPKREPPAPGPGGGSSSGMLLKIVGVLLLAVVAFFYFGRGPAVYAGPDDQAPNYEKHKHWNPATPAVLAATDIDVSRTQAAKAAALRGDPIPGVSNASPQFIEAVKRGDVTFYALRVYDTCAEDGDVVRLQIPIGAEVGPIPLTIAGTVISVPVVKGEPAEVNLIAVKDGVGGVTMGAQSSGGVWFSSVMQPGESERMPLTVN